MMIQRCGQKGCIRSLLPFTSTNVVLQSALINVCQFDGTERKMVPRFSTRSTVYQEAIFGVLVDVSGSMSNAYALDRSPASAQVTVEGTHAVFTSVLNIVKSTVDRQRWQDSIFVGAFGLQNLKNADQEDIDTCDLLFLLDSADALKVNGYEALIRLASDNGVEHIEKWVYKYLKEFEARILYSVLRSNTKLTLKLLKLIPSNIKLNYGAPVVNFTHNVTSFLTFGYAPVGSSEEKMVNDSSAYKLAREEIEKALKELQYPTPRPMQNVSTLLDTHLQQASYRHSRSTLHDKIKELVASIKSYIYGGTPMCKAMRDAENVFNEHYHHGQSKVLFILSDGAAADGDPVPIAKRLRDSGVTIVTCFLTAEVIHNPKCLYGPSTSWSLESGKQKLFEMSSTMANHQSPLSRLHDTNWDLPSCGESRLFIQVNTLDVVNEFCEIVVSRMNDK